MQMRQARGVTGGNTEPLGPRKIYSSSSSSSLTGLVPPPPPPSQPPPDPFGPKTDDVDMKNLVYDVQLPPGFNEDPEEKELEQKNGIRADSGGSKRESESRSSKKKDRKRSKSRSRERKAKRSRSREKKSSRREKRSRSRSSRGERKSHRHSPGRRHSRNRSRSRSRERRRDDQRDSYSNSSDNRTGQLLGPSPMHPALQFPPPASVLLAQQHKSDGGAGHGHQQQQNQPQGDGGKKRKSRWAPAEERAFVPGMPTMIPPNLNDEQRKAYLLQLQIEDVSRKLRAGDLGIPPNPDERSPSPEPIYDSRGIRLNTREVRTRRKLEETRHQLIQQMMAMNPGYKPPPDYKAPMIKLHDKVWIPQEEHPEINFVGLLIGPRGNTLKSLEKETGAKVIIRGKGSVKEGKIGRKDGQPLPGEDEPLHAYITATTAESIKKAADKIRKMIQEGLELPESENELRKLQLRELALLNGTLRAEEMGIRCSNCGAVTHKSWECPDRPNVTHGVICTICGGAGHISKDCKSKPPGYIPQQGDMGQMGSHQQNPALDEEYSALMAELGEGDSSYGKGVGMSRFSGSKPSLFGSGGTKGAICSGPVDPDTQQKPLFVVNLAEQLKGKIIDRPTRPRGPDDYGAPSGPPRYAQHNPLGNDAPPQMPYDPNAGMANYGMNPYMDYYGMYGGWNPAMMAGGDGSNYNSIASSIVGMAPPPPPSGSDGGSMAFGFGPPPPPPAASQKDANGDSTMPAPYNMFGGLFNAVPPPPPK